MQNTQYQAPKRIFSWENQLLNPFRHSIDDDDDDDVVVKTHLHHSFIY